MFWKKRNPLDADVKARKLDIALFEQYVRMEMTIRNGRSSRLSWICYSNPQQLLSATVLTICIAEVMSKLIVKKYGRLAFDDARFVLQAAKDAITLYFEIVENSPKSVGGNQVYGAGEGLKAGEALAPLIVKSAWKVYEALYEKEHGRTHIEAAKNAYLDYFFDKIESNGTSEVLVAPACEALEYFYAFTNGITMAGKGADAEDY